MLTIGVVWWEDSCIRHGGIRSTDDFGAINNTYVGHILKRDKSGIWLCSELCDTGDERDDPYREGMFIPTGCITRVKKLKVEE